MARGLDQHKARVAAVQALGRGLNRRARSKCELREDRTSLTVVEVPPLPEEPEDDCAVMLCERCAAAMADERRGPAADTLRFLENALWSQVAPAQVVAVRVARRLAAQDVPWARDLLDTLYLDPDVEARVDAG